jgi:hypothetical protein
MHAMDPPAPSITQRAMAIEKARVEKSEKWSHRKTNTSFNVQGESTSSSSRSLRQALTFSLMLRSSIQRKTMLNDWIND